MNKLTKVLTLLMCSTYLEANSLVSDLKEVLNTNPIIQERLKNYRGTIQDLDMAQSGYLPKLDVKFLASQQEAGGLNDEIEDKSFRYYERSLKLTQNIFNGFKTKHQVDYEESRILGAAYNYIEKADDLSFNMVGAYLNILKNEELRKNAQKNLEIHKNIFKDAQELYNAKMLTQSDLGKIKTARSMAKINLITQKNTLRDVTFSYSRILGRKPIIEDMSLPSLNIELPKSIEEATLYAMQNNPSILVGKYNVKLSKALYYRDKHKFYPKVDFELEQYYHSSNPEENGYESDDDRFIARVAVTWNLYNGGFDSANLKKKISKIAQEAELKRNLKREVIESLELSWSAYEVASEQLMALKEYDEIVQNNLYSTLEEYKLGKRSKKTLFDLLSAYSDVINSNSKIISSKYNQLFAKFRILDAMGTMVVSVLNDKSYKHKVNLDVKNPKITVDTLPISLDKDKDGIEDDLDICGNSLKGNNIMPYGCIKKNSMSKD